MKPRKLNCGICQRVTERNDFMCLSCGTFVQDCGGIVKRQNHKCPKCYNYNAERLDRGIYNCRDCQQQFSVIGGPS